MRYRCLWQHYCLPSSKDGFESRMTLKMTREEFLERIDVYGLRNVWKATKGMKGTVRVLKKRKYKHITIPLL